MWIGKWFIAVGAVHSLFGVVFMRSTLAVFWTEGLFNTVNGQLDREATFWFLLAGVLLILLGAMIDMLEKRRLPVPSVVTWGLAIAAGVGVVLMPVSGVWLLIPPVLGLVFRHGKPETDGDLTAS